MLAAIVLLAGSLPAEVARVATVDVDWDSAAATTAQAIPTCEIHQLTAVLAQWPLASVAPQPVQPRPHTNILSFVPPPLQFTEPLVLLFIQCSRSRS